MLSCTRLQAALPTYPQLLTRFREVVVGRRDVRFERTAPLRYTVNGRNSTYDLYHIRSAEIGPQDRVVLIRAGIHGDEIHGPLTIYHHLSDILDRARARGVKVIICPLDNPSGYASGTRYNMEGDRGEEGNNDFLRYRLTDGRLVGDLKDGRAFGAWYWSSDTAVRARMPQETARMHDFLRTLPLDQIVGALDLHGDNFLQGAYTYYYAFGDTSVYAPLVERLQQRVAMLRNVDVSSGYLHGPSYRPECLSGGAVVDDDCSQPTDQFGAIVRHDGSLSDLFHRLGTRHSITVETTADTDAAVAQWVHLSWIYAMLDWASA